MAANLASMMVGGDAAERLPARAPGRGLTLSPKPAQILEAARTLFLAHGFGATSVDALAREAGVSKATLYAHFANKEELFAAIIAEACRTYAETIPVQPGSGLTVTQVLEQTARSFLRFVMGPQPIAVHRIVVSESGRFPDLGRVFFEAGPRYTIKVLEDYLAALDAEGELAIPDPAMAAEQFFGMLKGYRYTLRLLGLQGEPSDAEIEEAAVAAVAVFVKGHAA